MMMKTGDDEILNVLKSGRTPSSYPQSVFFQHLVFLCSFIFSPSLVSFLFTFCQTSVFPLPYALRIPTPMEE